MSTEYKLAVKHLEPLSLNKLKKFMKELNSHYPIKGHAKMNKKEIIHFIATLHHNVLSGSGILDFGLKFLKKAGEGIAKEVKKNVVNGVKDLALTTGDILLKNREGQASQPPDENQQRLLQELEQNKQQKDWLKMKNEENKKRWGNVLY